MVWLCVFSRRGGTLYFHVEGYDSPLIGTVFWNWVLLFVLVGGMMYIGHYFGFFVSSNRNDVYGRRFERMMERLSQQASA